MGNNGNGRGELQKFKPRLYLGEDSPQADVQSESSCKLLVAEGQLHALALEATVHSHMLDGSEAEAFQVVPFCQCERQGFQFALVGPDGNFNMLLKPRL